MINPVKQKSNWNRYAGAILGNFETCFNKNWKHFLGEKDHSACCKQRGIPDRCESVCAGRGFTNYSQLDCITTLMPAISSCFIENTGQWSQ